MKLLIGLVFTFSLFAAPSDPYLRIGEYVGDVESGITNCRIEIIRDGQLKIAYTDETGENPFTLKRRGDAYEEESFTRYDYVSSKQIIERFLVVVTDEYGVPQKFMLYPNKDADSPDFVCEFLVKINK